MTDTTGIEEHPTAIGSPSYDKSIRLRGVHFARYITTTLDPLTDEDRKIIDRRVEQYKERITKRVRAWRAGQ